MIRIDACPDGLLEINIENYSSPEDNERQRNKDEMVSTQQRHRHPRVIVNTKVLRNKKKLLHDQNEKDSLNLKQVNSTDNDEIYRDRHKNVEDYNIDTDFSIIPQEKKKRKVLKLKTYLCEICNKSIRVAANFNRHKRKHEMDASGYECKICKSKFASLNSLSSHTLIHSNVRPYACQYCPKTFRQKNQVTVHTRIHTQERPFVCKYCDASFIQSSAHLAHVRVHEGIRLHCCTFCDKTFTEKGSLNRHTRIHTRERPHSCDICDRLFVDRTGMLRHRRSHTNDRPYSCTLCPKSFTRKENIKRHLIAVHKDINVAVGRPRLIRVPPELVNEDLNVKVSQNNSVKRDYSE